MYKVNVSKDCLDFLLSLCGIVVLSPILAVLAVLVRVKLGESGFVSSGAPGQA